MIPADPSSDILSDTSRSRGTIYLLRHGAVRSYGNGKRYIGWQDLPLSDAGLEQAGIWAAYFTGLALEEICCSDLVRCRETARIIADRCSLEPQVFPELREVYLGAWEGRRFDEIKTHYPQAFQERGDHIAEHRPPGGESFRDLHDRVWPVFESVVGRLSGRALMVTHAGVIRVLVCRLLGIPLENLFGIGQAHGALNIVEVRPEGYRIQVLNLQSPQ